MLIDLYRCILIRKLEDLKLDLTVNDWLLTLITYNGYLPDPYSLYTCTVMIMQIPEVTITFYHANSVVIITFMIKQL